MDTIDTISQTDHNDLCMYLNTWLEQFDQVRRKYSSSTTTKLPYDYARTVNSTLSDLLVIDANENGL